MDPFEVNKLIGSLLGTVFVAMSIGIASDAIFAAPMPDKPGLEIVAPEGKEHGDPGNGGQPAGPESIIPLLATADPAVGGEIFKRCTQCHTGENGGANKAGPNLWNIVNRKVASHEGFSYSKAMKEFGANGKAWDYEHLGHFLFAPKAYVKGTIMGFAGLKKTDERANLIAYLRTLSDSPAPLPEVAAPAAGEAAPAAGHEEPAKPTQ